VLSRVTRILLFSIVFVTFFSAGNAVAAIREGALTLTPFIAGHIFSGNENVKNSPEYGLGISYNFTDHWAAELTGSMYEMKDTSGTAVEADVIAGRLDALYHFQPKEKIIPYFAVGLGGVSIDTDPSGHDSEDYTFNYGFGLKIFTTKDLALRLDLRHLMRFDSSAGHFYDDYWNNLLVSGGIAYQIGGADISSPMLIDGDEDGIVDNRDRCLDTPPGYPVDQNGCPVDSDGDGVVDAEDLCAATDAGLEVDANGCPIVAVETVIEDTDGDGIADIDDKCPNTPLEIPVNSYGCPLDSDGDTIFDIDDDCPNTPAGTAVGPDGCGPDEVNIKMRYEDDSSKAAAFSSEHPEGDDLAALAEQESLDLRIRFAPNRSVIDPRHDADMKKAAAFIAAHPGVRVMVEGHTDSTGASGANLRLSQKRADTVRWILVRDYGVPADRIIAKGFGESKPIADNTTQEGRARNRRVLMSVIQE